MEIKPPSSPPSSTSDSQNSATQPIQRIREGNDVPNNNGVLDAFEKKPERKPELTPQHFQVLKSVDYVEKYQKYEANYTHRLMAKYFSKNDIYGGNIFDEKMTIDGETIMSSRWPCIRSFANPVQGFDDQSTNSSTSTAETPSNMSNGKHTPKKNG